MARKFRGTQDLLEKLIKSLNEKNVFFFVKIASIHRFDLEGMNVKMVF